VNSEERLVMNLQRAESEYRTLIEPYDKFAYQIHATHYTPKFIQHDDGSIEPCGTISKEAEVMIDNLNELKAVVWNKVVKPSVIALQRYQVNGA